MTPFEIPPDLLVQVMPASQSTFTYAGYALCLIALIVTVRVAIRASSLVPLALLVGGGICVLWEPIVDVLGKAWFPREGQWMAVEAFGRAIPQFLLASYVWYVGGQSVYIFYRLSKGASRKELWLTYLAIAVIDFVLESPPLHTGMAAYYGSQPFELFKMPLWWTVVNPLTPILSGCIGFGIRKHLTGAKAVLAVVIPPIADGIANGGCAWPMWVALNSDVQPMTVRMASLATLCLGLAVMWFIGRLATSPAAVSGWLLRASTDDRPF